MKKFYVIAIAIIIVSIYLIVGHKSAEKIHPIKVGVLLPLSGDVAIFGEKAREGFQLAESLYPKDRVEFIYEDTGGYDASSGVRAANKLLSIDKVDFLLGPYGPEQALGIVPLTKETNVPIFAFSLCSKSFIPYKNLFCGYPSSEEQLQTALPFIQKTGLKKLALIMENSDYGIETDQIMRQKAAATGYSIVLNELIQPKDKDFRSTIAKILSKHPDGIFIAVIDPGQAFNFFKQLYETGYRGTRIAYIDVDPKYLSEYGEIAESIYAPGVLPNNYSEKFTRMFKEKYGKEPDLYSAVAYDITRVTLDTAKENDWSVKDLTQRVLNKTISDSAIPGMKFLNDRTVSFPLELQVSKNGKYVKAEY